MRALALVTNPNAPFFRQQVATLAEHGVETTVVPVPGAHDPESRASRSVLDYLRYYPRVWRHLADGCYDLVHANYGLTGPHAIAQPHLPVVLTLWGSDLLGPLGTVGQWSARCADEVVVMSPAMASTLAVDAHVIPHGVDLTRFEPRQPAAARATLGWDEDRRHVLFPYDDGRPEKAPDRARRIVDAVRDRLADPVALRQVTGVPHEHVPTYMNAADALLLTSRREGSPNVVKEAMACNLPVVSTDVGDVRRRLADVSPSAVATTDEALVDALTTILERRNRSDGRDAVREVSVERTGERLLAVYRAAVG